MEMRFCPHCEREVRAELIAETEYRLWVCADCGLGLGLQVDPLAERSSSARISNAVSPDEPLSLDAGPIFKRQMRRLFLLDRDSIFREVMKARLIDRALTEDLLETALGSLAVERYMQLVCENQRPDLVICGLELEDMTGLEAAFALRGIEKGLQLPHVPILFVSDQALSSELKATLEEIGRTRFLVQPTGDVQKQSARLLQLLEKLLAAS